MKYIISSWYDDLNVYNFNCRIKDVCYNITFICEENGVTYYDLIFDMIIYFPNKNCEKFTTDLKTYEKNNALFIALENIYDNDLTFDNLSDAEKYFDDILDRAIKLIVFS